MAERLRIAIGGIALEASTFCPHRTTLEEFRGVRGDGDERSRP